MTVNGDGLGFFALVAVSGIVGFAVVASPLAFPIQAAVLGIFVIGLILAAKLSPKENGKSI